MASRSDALRERYALYSHGDLERALDLWAEDFVWEGSESDLPGAGRHEGKQAAIDAINEEVSAWDMFELSADEFIEQGDTVVVLGHIDVTKGDQSARLPFVHVLRYRGEQIVNLRAITDSLHMARLLGVG
jgi:ketosteroid isomerase-like protein